MVARKIKISGANQVIVSLVGVATGIGLAVEGLSPTGSTLTDWFVLIAVGVGAVWSSASAPWWALSALAAVAAALAPPVYPLLIGLGVFALSLAVGVVRSSQPIERAVVAGAAILTFSMAREVGWFGINTLIAVVLVGAVAMLGASRRSHGERRLALTVVGASAATVVLVGAGFAALAMSARADLTAGNQHARAGLGQLKKADFDNARISFERAADAFERADGRLGSFATQPARLVPVVGQHRNAGHGVSVAAAATSRAIANELAAIDFDRLKIVDGRIDPEAVAELREPLARMQKALEQLDGSVVDGHSPWLVGRAQDEFTEIRGDIAEQLALSRTAIEALRLAPEILGQEEERVYFVMFTTPAEARGQGGFMGNYAELTIDDGSIELTEFGRHSDLNRDGDRPRVLRQAPQDWIDRYATAGFRYGPDGLVGRDPWSNITISPHFPSTAEVVAELYPQSGGRHVDGVFSLDVYALESLIGLVGPIQPAETRRPLNGRTTADFLLVDQYEISDARGNTTRVDQLDSIARTTLTRLLSTNPPDPIDLGRALAPMVEQRRIYGWLLDDDEQALVTTVGMDGALLPDLGDRHGYAVTVVNDGSSKMDTFLGRTVTLRPGEDHDRLSVTIHHDAPIDTLPDYAIGSTSDVPRGWARLWVTIYTNRPVERGFLDGQQSSISVEPEADVFGYSVLIDVAPGSEREFSLEFTTGSAASGTEFTVQPQPLVVPEVWQFGERDPIVVDQTTTLAADVFTTTEPIGARTDDPLSEPSTAGGPPTR